jgi:hypothetical protein
MQLLHRRHLVPLCVLGLALFVQAFATGCSKGENRNESGRASSQAAASVEPVPAAVGPRLERAGANPPKGGRFTCWIVGSGFETGDEVIVNGTSEIATTFGNPGLVTFVGDAGLLQGRDALTLVVVRPGTELRSNTVEAPVPAAAPKG